MDTVVNFNKEEIVSAYESMFVGYYNVLHNCFEKEIVQHRFESATERIMDELDLLSKLFLLKRQEGSKDKESETIKNEDIKKIEKHAKSVATDDKAFLKELAKSSNGKTSGIEYDNGEKTLYSGINDKVCESIINTVQFSKDKESGTQEFKEDDEPVKLIQIGDRVVNDLCELFPNLDLYNKFFTGDGQGFHEGLMSKGLSEKETQAFSDITDMSILHGDDSYAVEYENMIKKMKIGTLKESVGSINDEMQFETKKKHHF